jgi:hypothetical protein
MDIMVEEQQDKIAHAPPGYIIYDTNRRMKKLARGSH